MRPCLNDCTFWFYFQPSVSIITITTTDGNVMTKSWSALSIHINSLATLALPHPKGMVNACKRTTLRPQHTMSVSVLLLLYVCLYALARIFGRIMFQQSTAQQPNPTKQTHITTLRSKTRQTA